MPTSLWAFFHFFRGPYVLRDFGLGITNILTRCFTRQVAVSLPDAIGLMYVKIGCGHLVWKANNPFDTIN